MGVTAPASKISSRMCSKLLAHLVIAWGSPTSGGDSSRVQGQLKNVQQIQATTSAFSHCMEQIQATFGAFAAILADGSVIAWGSPTSGGDSSGVQGQLRIVQQIQATNGVGATTGVFAAILADGSVIAWGSPENGGDSSSVQDQLKNVQQVQAARAAFAAILPRGDPVTWGGPVCGGSLDGKSAKVTKGSVSYLSSPCFSTSIGGIGGPARVKRGILAVMYWISIIRGGEWSWVQFPRVTRSRAPTLEAHSP